MKPTLFWTLKPKWWVGGFEVMRVTTVKPLRYHGSDPSTGESTHALAKDCRGQFETQEAAELVIVKIARARTAHAQNCKILSDALRLAEKAERDAIDKVIAGAEYDVAPSPLTLVSKAAGQLTVAS